LKNIDKWSAGHNQHDWKAASEILKSEITEHKTRNNLATLPKWGIDCWSLFQITVLKYNEISIQKYIDEHI
jgi:hypothetical protein